MSNIYTNFKLLTCQYFKGYLFLYDIFTYNISQPEYFIFYQEPKQQQNLN